MRPNAAPGRKEGAPGNGRAFTAVLSVALLLVLVRPAHAYSGGLVSAGEDHSCTVRKDGTVACWGDNAFGQSTPPPGSFSAVSAGGQHTCGIQANGSRACWGNDDLGQAAPPAGTFIAVASGFFHSCAIRADGTLAC